MCSTWTYETEKNIKRKQLFKSAVTRHYQPGFFIVKLLHIINQITFLLAEMLRRRHDIQTTTTMVL